MAKRKPTDKPATEIVADQLRDEIRAASEVAGGHVLDYRVEDLLRVLPENPKREKARVIRSACEGLRHHHLREANEDNKPTIVTIIGRDVLLALDDAE